MNISLVIPAYNAEATINETLDSVAAQSHPVDEIVIVDDASEDATVAHARAHKLQPRVIEARHAGAPATLNTGIKAASGELICFLDADDLWTANKIELQVGAIKQNPSLAGVFGMVECFVCPTVSSERAAKLDFLRGPQKARLMPSYMGKTSLFTSIGLLDESLSTGYFIDWFDRAQQSQNFDLIPQLTLRRRIRPGTLSSRPSKAGSKLAKDFLLIARRAIQRKRQAGMEPSNA